MIQGRLGGLAPRYGFALNPHREACCTRCPPCRRPTRLREFAPIVAVKDFGMLVVGKTCRFCPPCELIIAHQDESGLLLSAALTDERPAPTGGDYYGMGMVGRKKRLISC